MKKRFPHKFFVVLAAISPMVFAACVAEDLSDCPPTVYLRVMTDYERPLATRAAADLDWYDGRIGDVSVMVFDQNDRFVTSWHGPEYVMGEDYIVPLVLPHGPVYHFVAWTNHHTDEYELSHWHGTDNTGLLHHEASMDLVLPASRNFTEDLAHRHQGTLTSALVYDGKDTDHTIVISPHTYRVNFVLRGLPESGNYDLTVGDSNSSHAYSSTEMVTRAGGNIPYTHTRDFKVRGSEPEPGDGDGDENESGTRAPQMTELVASTILLQIGDNTPTSFAITNGNGSPLYPVPTNPDHTGDLLEVIKTAYNVTLEGLINLLRTEYEYTITMTFGAMMDVRIEVNGWEYKPQETVLD